MGRLPPDGGNVEYPVTLRTLAVRARKEKALAAGLCHKCRNPREDLNRNMCIACSKAGVERMRSHPEYAGRRAIQAAKVKAIVKEFKSKPCVDCGIKLPPQVMHADHIIPKGYKVGSRKGKFSYSVSQTVADLAKCEVRCPNCHGMRHYNEEHAGDNEFDKEAYPWPLS